MARIHIGKDRLYVASGRNIFELSCSVNSDVTKIKLHRNISVPFNNLSRTVKNSDNNQILASALSYDNTMFAVATSSKQCFIYDILNDWIEVRPPAQLSKAPTAIIFDTSKKFVIISDRSGNVRRYHLEKMNFEKNTVCHSLEEKTEGELLLGHVSMVLDIVLSEEGRFLISADRDEKIRISRYPQCYIIHQFCLGHTSYVNSINSKGSLVFSAGGDGTLRVWNIDNGEQLAQCNCFEKKSVLCCKMFLSSTSEIIKLAVVFQSCANVQIITFIERDKSFQFEEMTCSECIFDIAVDEDEINVWAITKSGIALGRVGGSRLELVSGIDESVKNSLGSFEVVQLPLERKTGFNNIEDYKRRKHERISRKKQKLSFRSA
ncbi:unnamed protein product [Thelazia callipaeda]|uniref:tRNA (guanine-N(7)-)-methyltransferase non-catalytic subunit n=1 Tax=Thelazia callipaeda TaxID=103827 RepID=A0A0N5D5B1_THECL|nr:unnamed protein product [Thelazia callipaeda]